MKYGFIAFFFLFTFWANAQQTFTFDQSIKVSLHGNEIEMPFAVGINAAQFQQMDTNGDGNEEWVIWDINSRRILVFQTDGDDFVYLPEMSYYFPNDVAGFMVLADFNGNGKKDLFTSSPFGIRAYRNITQAGAEHPNWELAQNFLRLDNGSNLQANNLDIPLIMDIDGDGDLDIATFNFASGDYLEFYLNSSVERKGIADIDGFAFPEARWGNFEFCNCGIFSFGVTCSGLPMGRLQEIDAGKRIQHSGGHSVLYTDFNGDGVLDLLMGQDQCNILYYLPNKGSNAEPIFDEFSTELPNIGPLPEFPVFHTSYLWEKGLIISSNSSAAAGASKANFRENVFSLDFNESFPINPQPFLQSQILDFGENSRPFFKGLQSSGELIVTANSYENGKVVGKAFRFVSDQDRWTLLDEDYKGLSSMNLDNLQYTEFLSTSNQQTYWVAGVDTVNFTLQHKVFIDTDPNLSTLREISFPGINSRPSDHIEMFVYENKDYLLLARQTGELILFELDINAQQSLQLIERDFLGFGDNPANRNLNVHVIPSSKPSIYAIDQRGVLVFIPDFMNQSQRQTIEIQYQESQLANTKFGRNTWITSVPVPFSENRDLLLGNTGGGLEYLKFVGDSDNPNPSEFQAKIYPNPNRGQFKVLVSQASNLTLINSLGQIMAENLNMSPNQEYEIQANFLSPGLYFLQLSNQRGERITRKVIIQP